MKILIAEKEKITVDSITGALNEYMPQWQLLTTDSGRDCLDIVKDNPPDLVILGLELTDIPGLDVIEQLCVCYRVPVMAISRPRDELIAVKAFEAGAAGYMAKPLRQLEMVARIKAILRFTSCAAISSTAVNSHFGAPASAYA
jgi:two-component system, OmpR family, response regulator VicR